MTNLSELIKRDNITAAWFWVTSKDAGPYAETEQFDAVFVRETNNAVGGGYMERRTLYVKGIGTSQAESRRENGGRTIRPDLLETLGGLLADAIEIDNNPTFREWVEYHADADQPAWEQLGEYERLTHLRNRLRAWLGDSYDEYLTAHAD